jgi:hypothetical protein
MYKGDNLMLIQTHNSVYPQLEMKKVLKYLTEEKNVNSPILTQNLKSY